MKKNNGFLQKFLEKISSDKEKERVCQIDLTQIRANLSQPRQEFDVDSIIKLADSIRQYGILQPLSIRKADGGDGYRYELIAGERRLRAARMLGLKTVPCLIVEVDDSVSAELALVENMLRENLNMFDQATAFASLSEKFGLTQEEIAQKMSLSQSAVANKIRLLKLSAEERKAISEAGLTERHARAFLRITNKAARSAMISRVISSNFNVAETEKAINDFLSAESNQAKKKQEAKSSVRLTSDVVCSNIDRYVEKLRSVSNLVTVDRQVNNETTIITLTVKNEAI